MISKYLTVAIVLISFGGGTLFGSKVLDKKCPDLKCPAIPDCSCPPSVEMANFDVSKINNKKGEFHLHNSLSNVRIVIEAKDSLLVKQLLKAGAFV